jgi:hypothetical protein
MDIGKKGHFFYKCENCISSLYRGEASVGCRQAGTGAPMGVLGKAKHDSNKLNPANPSKILISSIKIIKNHVGIKSKTRNWGGFGENHHVLGMSLAKASNI